MTSEYDCARNHGDLTDDEYRQMRQEEEGISKKKKKRDEDAEEPLYFSTEEDDSDDSIPESTEHDTDEPVYDLRSDFIVVLPGQIIRIPQGSNLSWLTLFYALPKELVEKRAVYLDLPRNIRRLLNDEKARKLIQDDSFLELVWDCYAWGIWQELKVPNNKGEYRELPGDWKNYSGDFPLWRMSYLITNYFRLSFETEMEWSFQRLFMMPEDYDVPWMDWRHFSNLIRNLTDRIVEKQNLQPTIDTVWKNRQPEDYNGFNFKRGEFLRKWNHSRNHPHESMDKWKNDNKKRQDTSVEIESQVLSAEMVDEFKASLSETDKRILEMRMEGKTLQEITDALDYKTPSAVKKRIDRIAEQYEAFSNPITDDGERVKPTKKKRFNH